MIETYLGTPGSGMSYHPPISACFEYQPVHDCPVCGAPVFDVPPFNDDCTDCTLWFALLLAGGAL